MRYRTGDASNPKIMHTAHKLASVLQKQKKYDKAEEYLNWCLKAKNKTHGSGSLEFAETHQALGNLHLAEQNYPKAINRLKIASALYEKHTGPSSKETIAAKQQLADAYLKSGDNINYEKLMASTTQIASVPSVDKVDEIPAVSPETTETATAK